MALVLVAGSPAIADAQFLYKLIGRDGRVTYTDTEPKGFDGQVIRIEADTAPTVLPPVKAADVPARKEKEPGMAERRRQSRGDLEKRLRAAQAKVEAARKARADADDAKPEEMQVVQRRYAPLRSGQSAPRPNCFHAVDPGSGVASLVCPMQVPGEQFFDRQAKLDAEVARAEAELREAERAFRRGTD